MSQQLEEHFKIGVKCCLNAFVKDVNVQGTFVKYFFFQFFFVTCLIEKYPIFNRNDTVFSEKELPNSFRASERAFVHQSAKSLDLLSKSRGKGANRAVTIYKKGSLNYLKNDSKIQLTQNSRKAVLASFNQNPLNRQERQELVPTSERDRLKGNICQLYYMFFG